MKSGRSVVDLAAELTRQAAAKRDYLVDTRAMKFEPHEDGPALHVRGIDNDGPFGGFALRRTAHAQFSDRTGIPKRYYDRMLAEAPDLLCRNLNHWLDSKPEKRLLRTIDGQARALLSDRYRVLDNYDFAEATLPVIGELDADVRSCEITEDRMYIKVVRPELRAEIAPPGVDAFKWGEGHTQVDVIEAGLVLSNSEVGSGALSLAPAIHTVHCTNLAVSRETTDRRAHLGKVLGGGGDDVQRYISDEARQKADEAVWLAIRDLTRASLDGTAFADQVERLRAARGDVPAIAPAELIQRVEKRFDLTDGESASVLEHLAAGRELTRYAISNAITRAAQDVESYDRASALERIGGDVIDLSSNEWRAVSA
jgi:hypothetical protein